MSPKFSRNNPETIAAERAVNRLHPGPDMRAFIIPEHPPETDAEKLARMERAFLKKMLESQIDGFGKFRSDAIAIIVQRAKLFG